MVTPEEPTPDDDNYIYEDDEEFVPIPSELDIRTAKKVSVTVEPFGFSIVPIPTTGVTAGYHFNPNRVGEFNYAWGGSSVANADYRVELTTLRLKQFVFGKMYLNGEVGYRNVRAIFPAGTVEAFTEEQKSSVGVMVAGGSVGHEWRTDQFVLGCDWVGVDLPVGEYRQRGQNMRDLDDKDDSVKTFEKIAFNQSVQAFRFYFGTSF
jgi:hypothetical protein